MASIDFFPGNGAFIQCTAVDRYHFTSDHLMHEGETLYDLLEKYGIQYDKERGG